MINLFDCWLLIFFNTSKDHVLGLTFLIIWFVLIKLSNRLLVLFVSTTLNWISFTHKVVVGSHAIFGLVWFRTFDPDIMWRILTITMFDEFLGWLFVVDLSNIQSVLIISSWKSLWFTRSTFNIICIECILWLLSLIPLSQTRLGTIDIICIKWVVFMLILSLESMLFWFWSFNIVGIERTVLRLNLSLVCTILWFCAINITSVQRTIASLWFLLMEYLGFGSFNISRLSWIVINILPLPSELLWPCSLYSIQIIYWVWLVLQISLGFLFDFCTCY